MRKKAGCFCFEINETNKALARPIREKGEKKQIIIIRNKR